MRVQLIFLLLALVPTADAVGTKPAPTGYSLDAMSGVRLVYLDELIELAKQPMGTRFNRWSAMLPRSIHAVAAGDHTIFALHRPDCHGHPGPYWPSHCGDGQLMVLAFSRIPEVGEVVGPGGVGFVTSVMFVGDLLGPRRSGCLAFPNRLRVERARPEASEYEVSLLVDAEFEAESVSTGESCGIVSVNGQFNFNTKRLEDYVDGGVRYLFGCDGQIKFAALCATPEVSHEESQRE